LNEDQENCHGVGDAASKAVSECASVTKGIDLGPQIVTQAKRRPGHNPQFSRLKNIVGIDRAIGFTVLARGWSVLSGALTVVLIARFLSPPEQGYYYTFASLVSLQVVFELGFSFVILQLAAHESSELRIHATGEITGNEVAHSRLASILQKAIRWYSAAAVLMAAVLLAVGLHFFSTHGQSSGPVAWKLPWLCLVIAAIFTFQMDPVFSFLEGCGFVAQVARMRLTQAIAGTTLAWLTLTLHHGLFAPAAVVTGQAVAGFAFLVSKRRLLLPLLRRSTGDHVVGWRTEIWPFQWPIAVSFFCSYAIGQLFNPVLFAYRGPVEAGRMGMSLTMANALGTVAFAWINTKASPFGSMIARRDFVTLDRVFYRALLQSGSLLLGADISLLVALVLIEQRFPHLALRILPIPVFALLIVTIFLNHLLFSEAIYLRAHKREPFLVLSILTASLVAVSTFMTGRLWGATGVTIGFFITGVFSLAGGTYIFLTRRRMWHRQF
jgi:hypothetical protein